MLDEIQAGIFDGWTYEQIEEQMPQEYAARKQDKLKYRYCALFHRLTIALLISILHTCSLLSACFASQQDLLHCSSFSQSFFPGGCRYPSGESYLDVIQRLEPVIIEIERERECVCIVAHQAVLRALYGYFNKIPLKVHLLPDPIGWPSD